MCGKWIKIVQQQYLQWRVGFIKNIFSVGMKPISVKWEVGI